MVKSRSVKETGIITDVPNAARNYKDRIFRMVFRETLVLNVNVGYNKILMERCRQLSDYAQFVSEVRKRLSKKIPLSEAVNEAVEDCIQRGILAEFLSKNRAEVIKVSIYEYDEAKTMRMFRDEGYEEGQIQTTIEMCLEFNLPSDDILQRLMSKFQLSESQAQECLDKYGASETAPSPNKDS